MGVNENGRTDYDNQPIVGRRFDPDEMDEDYEDEDVEPKSSLLDDPEELDEDEEDDEAEGTFVDPGVEDEEVDEEEADRALRLERELLQGLDEDEALGRAGADE